MFWPWSHASNIGRDHERTLAQGLPRDLVVILAASADGFKPDGSDREEEQIPERRNTMTAQRRDYVKWSPLDTFEREQPKIHPTDKFPSSH